MFKSKMPAQLAATAFVALAAALAFSLPAQTTVTPLPTHFSTGDFFLDVASGRIPGVSAVNKYGHAPAGIQILPTDFWDLADGGVGQQRIWLPPTEARIHVIASTSTADDLTDSGTGARTVEIFGLVDWDTAESSAIIDLDGNGTNNPTTVAMVIIHRMKVLTTGTGGSNAGVITATANDDGTITAQINIGEGQTNMAIYGVPSIQTAFMTDYYNEMHKAPGATTAIEVSLMVNPEPDVQLAHFNVKHRKGVQSSGTSSDPHPFKPYYTIPGPAIIKLQGIATTNDIDGSAGFDLIIMDN